jgi:magnesium-transporting ATPase (P-type)
LKTVSGTAIALLTVIILSVKFSIKTYVIDKTEFKWSQLNSYIEFIITGVTVLVVAVPEGLPLAVTLSLAYSVKVRVHFLVSQRRQIIFLFVENDEGQQLGEAS